MTTQLSPHFTLEELTISETAARRGLNNIPTGQNLANIKKTAERMEKVRAIVGGPIVVTSCYRSEAVNAAVGGSLSSAHMHALATDSNRPGLTPLQYAEKLVPHLKALGIDQLILEFDAWVHIGWTAGTPRGQVLTINHRTGGYVTGLH